MNYKKEDSIPELVQRRIPTFNGDGDTESTKYFISQLQQIENTCNNDADLLSLALDECKAKLRGGAFNLAQSSKITNLKELRDFVRENFLPIFTAEEIKAKLANVRQLENESISAYAKRVKTLKNDYARCHEEKYKVAINNEVIDEDEKKAFVHGLKLPMARLALSSQIEKSIEHLVNGAKAIEETEKLQNQGVNCQICQEIGHTSLSCPQMKNFRRMSQNNPIINFNKCARCLETNHSTANCPQLAPRCEYCSKMYHNAEQCMKRKADLRNTVICSFCQNKGHSISDCRIKSRMQASTQNPTGNMFSNYRPPQNPYTEKFCDFHKSRGHSTNECRMKREFESSQQRNPFNQITPNTNQYTNTHNTNNNRYTNTQTQNRSYNNNYTQQNTRNDQNRQNTQQNNYQGYRNQQPQNNNNRPQHNNNYQSNQYRGNTNSNNFNGPRQPQVPNYHNRQNTNQTTTDELTDRFNNMQIHYINGMDDITQAPENYNGSYE